MPKSPSPRMIEQSRCPKCEIRMMLVGVEPSLAGPDLRMLECPKCGLAYKALAEGPMKPRAKRAGSKAN
jgi:hypothetical protein